jgi:hypothetical protein
LIRLGPSAAKKPGDPEKLDDQEKLGDQKKLSKFSDKIKFLTWRKKSEGENQDKRERVIRERLLRFAQVPPSSIFEFVTQVSFLLFTS